MKALAMPEIQANLLKLGVQTEAMSVEQFEKFVRDDLAATVNLAKAAHITAVD
jgi:hypothetical protein